MADIASFKAPPASSGSTTLQRIAARIWAARARRWIRERLAARPAVDARFAREVGLMPEQTSPDCLNASWREHFPR